MKKTLLVLGCLLASLGVSAQVTCQTIGSQRFCNSPSGTSTTQRIGNMDYTNRSDGVTSTTQRIGNMTYTNRSDGTSVVCQQIGSQTFCN